MSARPAQLADVIWLVEGEGGKWLDRLLDDEPLHTQLGRLRGELTPWQAHLVIEQKQLRSRAGRRFPMADQMFFTPTGLQQATDWTIAQYKAGRMRAARPIIDLCCGIGGDLMGFHSVGDVAGVDRDPALAYLANHNLSTVSTGSRDVKSSVAVGDASQLCVRADVAVHADPDRRPSGRRSTRLEWHSPGRTELVSLTRHSAGAAIKLAPVTDATDELLSRAYLEWIGHGRECQQLVAWFGALALSPGRRAATVLTSVGDHHTLTQSDEVPPFRISSQLERLLVEPHAAVLAAGLAGEVAQMNDLTALTPGGGYLTGDDVGSSPFWTVFEVIDSCSFRAKRVSQLLRHYRIGTVEVKKRGVDVPVSDLQRRFSQPDGEIGTLFVMRIASRTRAVLARRMAGEF